MSAMTTLQAQWAQILELESEDWTHMSLELALDDPERMEEASLLLSPLNPWHGSTFRTGRLRFLAAHSAGYGADRQLVHAMLGRLDAVGIGGRLTLGRSIEGAELVLTQGPRL